MAKLNVVVPELNVTVDGVEYRQVEREAQAGDIVRHDKDGYSFLPKGAFYRAYVDEDGDVVIDDEDGEQMLVDEDYTVFEPVSKPQPARLKVGDYTKIINTGEIGGSAIDDSVKLGDVFEIIADDRSSTPFRGKRVQDGLTHWFKENRLVRATDEEVAAAKAALQPKFNVGDTAKLASLAGGILRGFNVGDIVTVVHNLQSKDDVHYRIKNAEGHTGYASKNGGLAPLTAEEIAQETLTAKWAAIGREVNEYKRGDVVSYVKGGVSAMGTVEDVSSNLLGVRVATTNLNDDSAKYSAVYKVEHNAVLLVPVEQRFDRVG